MIRRLCLPDAIVSCSLGKQVLDGDIVPLGPSNSMRTVLGLEEDARIKKQLGKEDNRGSRQRNSRRGSRQRQKSTSRVRVALELVAEALSDACRGAAVDANKGDLLFLYIRMHHEQRVVRRHMEKASKTN